MERNSAPKHHLSVWLWLWSVGCDLIEIVVDFEFDASLSREMRVLSVRVHGLYVTLWSGTRRLQRSEVCEEVGFSADW
jgi:hypothetical protein